MNFAFFFPGQGSQSLKMMDGFPNNSIVIDTFAEASSALDVDLWAMINAESSDAINQTINTQPLMLAAGISTYRVYIEAGGVKPTIMAGHSLGEYSALVAAGSLSFHDAIKLVRLRAELMQSAVPAGQGAMAAILGLDDDKVQEICSEASQNEVVESVNFNSPGQVVIAGELTAINRAIEIAKSAGAKRALLLPVSVPSHCSLMKPAAEKLALALNEITVNQPEITVINNVDVAWYSNPEDIKDALVRQLYKPVRWTETINYIVQQGIKQSAECGPGKVLAGLTKRINKEAVCAPLTNLEQVEKFIEISN